MVVATDHNAGSSPTLSPLRMLNMACTLFRLTPEEALTPPWRLAPERWAELQLLLGAPPSVAPDWKPA